MVWFITGAASIAVRLCAHQDRAGRRARFGYGWREGEFGQRVLTFRRGSRHYVCVVGAAPLERHPTVLNSQPGPGFECRIHGATNLGFSPHSIVDYVSQFHSWVHNSQFTISPCTIKTWERRFRKTAAVYVSIPATSHVYCLRMYRTTDSSNPAGQTSSRLW